MINEKNRLPRWGQALLDTIHRAGSQAGNPSSCVQELSMYPKRLTVLLESLDTFGPRHRYEHTCGT